MIESVFHNDIFTYFLFTLTVPIKMGEEKNEE